MKRPDTTLLAEPITYPVLPEPPRAAGFPVAASLAPVVVSLALWAITQSVFALVFAALGPVVAVAGVLDGRRQARKRRRMDAATHRSELEAFRSAVDARHDLERDAARWATPSARQILSSEDDPLRWRDTVPRLVSLGDGAMPSAIPLRGAEADPQTARWVRMLEHAPVTAVAEGGIGIVAPLLLARAYARALVLQLCHAMPPDRLRIVPRDDASWEWMRLLPHHVPEAATELCVVENAAAVPAPRSGDVHRVLIALATQIDELPPACHTVVRLRGYSAIELARWPAERPAGDIRPELVSAAEASAYALKLSAQALSAGVTGLSRLPERVDFADLQQRLDPAIVTAHGSGPAPSLSAAIGVGPDGPILIDLVRDGPHAIVAGTTGSGKSELLVSWVLALAAAHPPESLAVLLVDFKGGAAFTPLRALPHCVGLITDLNGHEAQRALDSLAAELRHREQLLRDHGARDIAELPSQTLARLLIVVDEFAAMLELSAELHALFVDLAARGRSLGVHLVLCTQRPAGVVRDALAANCALRFSFRVNNRADSSAVIGGEQAAALDPVLRGRGFLAGAANPSSAMGPTLVQVAIAAPADIAAVVRRWAGHVTPRRPWLEPVAAVVTLDELCSPAFIAAESSEFRGAGDSGLVLGLSDDPRQQRHTVARYRPDTDGNLFVAGAAGSGKSALLRTLWVQRPPGGGMTSIASDPEAAWDTLQALCGSIDRAHSASVRRILLVDDVDSLLARCPDEHAGAMREMLERILRDGPRSGLTVVLTARRPAGAVGALHSLCGSTLLLAMPSRTEHQLAGGELREFEANARPGAALWRGLRTQIAWIAPSTLDSSTVAMHSGVVVPLFAPRAGTTTAVISRTSTYRARALRAVFPNALVSELGDIPHESSAQTPGTASAPPSAARFIVGEPEAWQTEWALLNGLRRTGDLIFEGASLAELRMLGGQRALPPLMLTATGRALLLAQHGEMSRVSLDLPATSTSDDDFGSDLHQNY